MDTLYLSLLLAALAGAAIPVGALIACVENIQPRWLEREFRHSVVAFGGGVLLAAVSLVLVPEGIKGLSLPWVLGVFSLGGISFFLADRVIAKRGQAGGQMMAMLLDFVPEAIALGAALSTGKPIGLLLALLIALQNLPEGFNAFREMKSNGRYRTRIVLLGFGLLALIGPAAAFVGHQYLADQPAFVSGLMLFAASGIIYLTFEDIAPAVTLENHHAPPLGAVFGFLVGLVGHIIIT